jgi:DnaJ-class molecular chaperone
VLCDPAKREQYDVAGHAGVSERWSTEEILRGFDFGDFFGGRFADVGGIFGDLFGGRSHRGPVKPHAADLHHELSLSLEEAAKGGERLISITRSDRCKTCAGSGAKPAHSRSPAPSVKAAAKSNKQGPRRQCASSRSRRAHAVSAAEHSSNRRALPVTAAASNLCRTRLGCKFRPASTTG